MFWIKDFKGHSGCKVQLFFHNEKYIVKKTGSSKLKNSAEILLSLKSKGFNTPEIYQINDTEIHMQYLNGVDMKSYIQNSTHEDIEKLISFLDSYIEYFCRGKKEVIISKIIYKLKNIEEKTDLSQLNFFTDDLIEKLPSVVTVGDIHGDFTLENILFYKDQFYLIDANPTDINSVEFDANKLRQDLDCLWFVRNQNNNLTYKIVCDKISNHLKNKWEFMRNDYILIFMLIRILPYCSDEFTKQFLITEINKLWQL